MNRNRNTGFLKQKFNIPIASGRSDHDFPAAIPQDPTGFRKTGVQLSRIRQLQQIGFSCADTCKNFGQSLKMGYLTCDKFSPRIVLRGKRPAFANRSKKSYRVTVPSKSEIKMLTDLDDGLLKPRRLSGRRQNGVPPDIVWIDVFFFRCEHLDGNMNIGIVQQSDD
jgi:hypothetical protein